MAFFNRQEEVIDLELTQYGKILFSRGQFKPVFYTFLDDDIVYDKQYQTVPYDPISVANSVEEGQNEAEDRIKQIPRIHTQYNWGGSFTNWELAEVQGHLITYGCVDNGDCWFSGYPLIETDLDTFYHNIPLGDCVPGQNKAPAWEIHAYNEQFDVTSLNLNLTGTYNDTTCVAGTDCSLTSISKTTFYFGDLAIPQLNSSVGIVTSIEDEHTLDPFEKDIIFTHKFEDGRILTLKNGYLLLEINEHNTEFETENFSIEVFEYWDPKEAPNQLKPLRFFDDPSIPQAAKDIYVPPSEEQPVVDLYSFQSQVLGGEFVEYYFDLKVDEEIDASYLCDLVDKKKTIFADKELKCQEPTGDGALDIYGPIEKDPGEVC